uniref:Uncharacterized protein n=1 Tax=Cannabis sativa TaxID=3483 RepID=A0A803Q933_CANSA
MHNNDVPPQNDPLRVHDRSILIGPYGQPLINPREKLAGHRTTRVDPVVQAQLDQLKSLVQVLSDLELDRAKGSPFSTRINTLPLSTKFKMPT